MTQREILDLRKGAGRNPDPTSAVIYLQLADGSRYPHPGKINFVDVTVNQGTDTVQVRAVVPQSRPACSIDGQLVTVIAESGTAGDVAARPAAGDADRPGRAVRARRRQRRTRSRCAASRAAGATAQRLVVTKGLHAGEQVVTEGMQKVRPGQVVDATEAEPPAA